MLNSEPNTVISGACHMHPSPTILGIRNNMISTKTHGFTDLGQSFRGLRKNWNQGDCLWFLFPWCLSCTPFSVDGLLTSTAHSTAAQWLLALYSSLSPGIYRDLKGEYDSALVGSSIQSAVESEAQPFKTDLGGGACSCWKRCDVGWWSRRDRWVLLLWLRSLF